jgi:hypothetical protein
MPGNPPPFTDERVGLLSYIAQQRDGVRYAAYGLTAEQLRATPTRSALSVDQTKTGSLDASTPRTAWA